MALGTYVVVARHSSKILMTSDHWYSIVKFANQCRVAGGDVAVFKLTKG